MVRGGGFARGGETERREMVSGGGDSGDVGVTDSADDAAVGEAADSAPSSREQEHETCCRPPHLASPRDARSGGDCEDWRPARKPTLATLASCCSV